MKETLLNLKLNQVIPLVIQKSCRVSHMTKRHHKHYLCEVVLLSNASKNANACFFDLQARATSEIAVADLSDSENR